MVETESMIKRAVRLSSPLVPALLAGGQPVERSLCGQLAEIHEPLARTKAANCATTGHYWMSDELKAEAMNEVFHAIQAAVVDLTDNNLTYYILGRLNRNLPKIKYKLLHPGQSWDSNYAKDGRKNWKLNRHNIEDADLLVFNEPEKNLLETILSLCESPREERVVLLLQQNCTLMEVAGQVGLSIGKICSIRQDIHERFINYTNGVNIQIRGQVAPSAECGSIHVESEPDCPSDDLLAQY